MSFKKKSIEKLQGKVRFAALFGSYLRGSRNPFTDIDILVSCNDNDNITSIRWDLHRLSSEIGRTIHLTTYSVEEFERRLRYHDYKLLSILEDSSFLTGNEDYTTQLKYSRMKINDESIKFNQVMGVETLNNAIQNLQTLRYYTSIARSSSTTHSLLSQRNIQSLSLRNTHLALGYLQASQRMKQNGVVITLQELLSDGAHLLRTLISAEKKVKRKENLRLADIEHLIFKVQSEYEKIGFLR